MDSGLHGACGRPVTPPVKKERRHGTERVTILLHKMVAQFAVEQERSFTHAI